MNNGKNYVYNIAESPRIEDILKKKKNLSIESSSIVFVSLGLN